MEKNIKQSKLSRYPAPYNIENISTPLKQNKIKNKEIILNRILQDAFNQKKSKAKANLLYEKMSEEQNSNKINILEKKDKNNEKKKLIINNNLDKILKKNDLLLTSFYKKKHKNKIDIQNNNTLNYQVLNRNNSNKSSVIPSSDNQVSLINSRNVDTKNNISFFKNSEENKIRRHKTVYIKKNFSVDRNMTLSKSKYKNISKDDKNKYHNSNKNLEQKYCMSSSLRKQNQNNKNSTNNINSNVNIFNFGMQYSNAPHYFIRNSKMFTPYFDNYFEYNEPKINFSGNHEDILEESAILIQSAFRGCVIRFKINNFLKTYKGIELFHLFFKNKFWNIFKKNIPPSKIHFEFDSKLSISSISGFSALANSHHNKKGSYHDFNQKNLKESKETFFILNNNNIKNGNYENKYTNSFENNSNLENNKNNKLIWNKKMVSKNNSIISNIINQKFFAKNVKKINIDKTDPTLDKEKQKLLKALVTKKINKSRLILLKYFLRFYYNGILSNNDNAKKNKENGININAKHLKIKKLKKIIENKTKFHFEILFKYFSRFRFKGILNYIQTNQYLIINGGRLINIEQDSFFVYSFSKNKNRNLKLFLNKIIKLRKIIYEQNETKNEIIKKYFHKFRMAGIRHYMQVELKKKLMIKILILNMDKESLVSKKDNKSERDKQKYKMLNKLILRNNNYNLNCCKNIFDRWNLRTKIFSMISKDKEKKKKRRIKKRHNKKLAANINNINNINNNNINIPHITEISNSNKSSNNFSYNSNIKINLEESKNKLKEFNYDVGHPDSIVFIDNMKITDYFKVTKFINKINGIITKKFYFFKIINKNKKEEEEEKKSINNDVDFFMEDSSESDN